MEIKDFLAADLQWFHCYTSQSTPHLQFLNCTVLCFIVLCLLIEWMHVYKCDNLFSNNLSVDAPIMQ